MKKNIVTAIQSCCSEFAPRPFIKDFHQLITIESSKQTIDKLIKIFVYINC